VREILLYGVCGRP